MVKSVLKLEKVHPKFLLVHVHFHSYKMVFGEDKNYHISLNERMCTDSAGIAAAMGLQAEAKVDLELIIKSLESKISNATLFTL